MTLHLRRALSPLIIAAALAAALFASAPAPAQAAGCPTTPVSELGGKHWCYAAGDGHGNVHLWKPDSYNNQGAVTVVYIHGLDTGRNGPDTCTGKRPYVDCIWAATDWNIVQQFASSGVNGLFVAVEGRVGSESIKWSRLSDLITSITDKGKIAPPAAVTVAGHSAGMYTARAFWSDARVKHVISLDWVDGSLESQTSAWYAKKGGRELTLIGGSGNQQTIMDRMQKALPCPKAANPKSLTQTEIAEPCLYLRTSVGHMRVVFDKIYLPAAIGRSADIASSGGGGTAPAPTPTPGPTTVITRQPITPTEYSGPRLEIPIPGVEFSNIIRDTQITIPWLAQYIGGVYTFLISIVGLVAAVVMIIGGFQYVTSAGDKGRVGAARKRIVNALVGMVLAFGSYTLLYTLNPDLVAFDGLKIAVVGTENLSGDAINAYDEGGVIAASESSSEPVVPGSGEFPDLGSAGRPQPICTRAGGDGVMKCSQLCSLPKDKTGIDDETGNKYNISSLWPTSTKGMADPKNITKIPSGLPGIKSGRSTDARTLELLKAAGKIASDTAELQKIGVTGGPYVLHVTSGYRPLFVQIAFACDKENGTGSAIGSTLANPGGSLHGAGFALDINLETPGGSDASHCAGCSHAQQLNTYRRGAINIAKIMFAAGFRRVNNEIWHFEPASAPKPSCRCAKIEDCTFPARSGSAWLSAYNKVNEALSADPKNGGLKDAWTKITDVTYGGGTVNVNGSALSVPASPMGCGKKSNYDGGAL